MQDILDYLAPPAAREALARDAFAVLAALDGREMESARAAALLATATGRDLEKVLAGVRIGVPARWITPGLVDEVLAEAGSGQGGGRRFRALPAWLGVYFVLGLCLYAGEPYRQVLRELTAGQAAGRSRVAGAGIDGADGAAAPGWREAF